MSNKDTADMLLGHIITMSRKLFAEAKEAERLRERMRILKQVDATPGNTEHAAFGRDVRQHLALWDLEDAEDDTK